MTTTHGRRTARWSTCSYSSSGYDEYGVSDVVTITGWPNNVASHDIVGGGPIITHAVIYVDDANSGPGVGSPADPYKTIQSALDVAVDGDVVLVAHGTYAGVGNINLDFGGVDLTLRSKSGPHVTIIDLEGSSGGGVAFVSGETRAAVLEGFTIRGGGGGSGGGIYVLGSSPTIRHCVVEDNIATDGGGAHFDPGSDPFLEFVLFEGNSAAGDGGAIYCEDAQFTCANCTLTGNTAVGSGGGIYATSGSLAQVSDTIVWGNAAGAGHEIGLGTTADPSTLTVRYSDLEGGAGEADVEAGCTLDVDGTDLDSDPLFVAGLLHDVYLSQTAAGQGATSPCVDAGSAAAAALGADALTTRTDGAGDAGTVDLGYHTVYPLYITDVAWDQVGTEVDLEFTTMAGGDYVVEAADTDAYDDGLVYTTIATVLGAAQGTTAVSDDVGASPLANAFRFYRVRRTDLDAMSWQTAGVFELPINAAVTSTYFISVPLIPDPDHASVAAVFGEGAARQIVRTNVTVSDLDESNGAISRMRNASGTYSVLAGSAFSIEPGVGYDLYVGLGFQTQFVLRLTGYVPEGPITVPLTKVNNQATRWLGYSLPRPIKLSALGLVEAVTPTWAPSNKVRLLPAGSPGWFTYTYDPGTSTWSPSDPDLVPGMGIVFLRAGFNNLVDELVMPTWYLYPPNTW
jgi:predicted outer membrane repeat protein